MAFKISEFKPLERDLDKRRSVDRRHPGHKSRWPLIEHHPYINPTDQDIYAAPSMNNDISLALAALAYRLRAATVALNDDQPLIDGKSPIRELLDIERAALALANGLHESVALSKKT